MTESVTAQIFSQDYKDKLDSQIRLSPSIAKILIRDSAAHAYAAHSKLGGRTKKDTPSTIKGKVIDRLVFGLGPAVYLKSKGKGKDTELDPWVGHRRDNEQPLMVSADVYREACDCAGAVKNRLAKEKIEVRPELVQQRWYWSSPVFGTTCKAIVDLYEPGTVYDLKSASDMSDAGLTRAIEMYGYDIQAAAELEAYQVLFGAKARFRWVFVETGDVNDVRIIDPTRDQLEYGMELWQRACRDWKQCLETDTWPGRPDATLGPSSWRQAKINAKAAAEFDSELEPIKDPTDN